MEERSYKVLLKPLISGALILFILWKVGPSSIAEAFATSRWSYIVAAGLLGGVFAAMKSWRWQFVLSKAARPCTMSDAIKSYLGGMSVAIVTPGRVGEIARAWFLPFENKTPVFALAIADKVIDVTCVFAVAAYGAFRVVGVSAGGPALVLGAALAAGLFKPSLFNLIARPLRSWKAVSCKLDSSVAAVASIGPRYMAVALAVAMMTFWLAVIQFHLILNSFSRQPFAASAIVMPLLVFANFIPFVLSGTGAREGLAILLLQPYGVAAAAAVNTSLLLFIFNTAAPAVVGAFVAGRGAHKKEKA